MPDAIEFDPARCGGCPVLPGTRIRLAKVLAELAGGMSIAQFADEFGVDQKVISGALNALAVLFDKPQPNAPEKEERCPRHSTFETWDDVSERCALSKGHDGHCQDAMGQRLY